MNELKQELLPCPFNAGNPVVRPSNFGYYVSVQVPCEKYEYKEVWRTPYFQKKDECIKFWNTRATKANKLQWAPVPSEYRYDTPYVGCYAPNGDWVETHLSEWKYTFKYTHIREAHLEPPKKGD